MEGWGGGGGGGGEGGREGCDADNLFFYHLFIYLVVYLFFAASRCNAVKNIRFLCSGFYLCLTLS